MVKIGFTKKTHGLQGELKAQVEERYLEDFMNAEILHFEINGSKVPYFIEDVRVGNEILIKLEEIDDLNAAKLMTSKEFFLKKEQLLSEEQRTIKVEGADYFDIEGYELFSVDGSKIGELIEVINMPGQFVAVSDVGGIQKFVPLNSNFVKQIDRKSKKIILDLPEGLLDL